MENDVKKCTSCGKEVLTGFVEFKCPKCLKDRIIRCKSCRTLGATYACSKCGFAGP